MILVAGASGTLGSRIVRRLLDEQHPVRAMVRTPLAAERLRGAGADIVMADVRRPDTLRSAVRGMAAVITTVNAAARGGEDTIESVDRAGNLALIEAARDEDVEQFVFISAHGASEESPIPFLRAKGFAERVLRTSGVPYTILQPDLFMESWIGAFVVNPVRAGKPVAVVGAGERVHSFIAVDDVAAFAVAVVGNPPAIGRSFPIGGPHALSWLDIVEQAAEIVGRVIPVRHLSPGAPIPGLPETVAQIAAALDRYDSMIDTRPLAEELGVRLTSAKTWMERQFQENA